MILQNKEAAIRLKQNSSLPNKAYQVTGMLVLLCLVLGLTSPLKGEVIELFFPGVALISLVLAKVAERFSKKDFAILYPDRFEEPGFGDTKRIVHWNQVNSLRWTGSSEDSQSLKVHTKEFETPLGFFVMDLSDLKAEDRLTFIRYVRHAAADIPQERWPSFCRRVAVPLLKEMEERNKSHIDEDSQPRTLRETIILGILKFLASHPFLAGLLMPVSFLLALPLITSRQSCWTIAALLTISSIINIRLVWGAWIEPFTTTVLGAAAAFFVIGFFSLTQGPENRDSKGSLDNTKVLGYLALFLVGIPLAVSALAKGWLPKNMAMPIKWLALALFLMPVFLLPWSQRRSDKRSLEDLEREALRYWDVSERRIGNE